MAVDCADCPLRRLPVFETFSATELNFMRSFKAAEITIEPGTTLLSEGANSPQLFTALSGMGLRYKLLPNGRRQVLNFILPGAFLGLQSELMDGMQHSVEATTQMTLCVFNRSDFLELFRKNPERAYDVTWHASLEEHLLGESIASVGQMTAQQKLCWALVRFLNRCAELGLSDGDRCPFPYRQTELADALGLSSEHTSRTLATLRERGVLEIANGTLHIINRSKAVSLGLVDEALPAARPLL